MFFTYIISKEEPRIVEPTEFTPRVENGFLGEATSKILEIIQVNTPNKVWKDSTQYNMRTSHLQNGDLPIYTNEGHN